MYPLPEKLLSFPLRQSLSQDPAFPLYVHTNHTINRNSSVAALFFQGTSHKDRPDLATMWVVLGQPVTGVAIPLWPAAGKVPRIASGPGTAALNDLAKAVRSFIYPDSRGQMSQYLNVDRLRTYGGDGVLAKLIRIENRALSQASAALAAWKKKRPPQEKIAEVQEKIADDVFEAMAKEFSAVRIR